MVFRKDVEYEAHVFDLVVIVITCSDRTKSGGQHDQSMLRSQVQCVAQRRVRRLRQLCALETKQERGSTWGMTEIGGQTASRSRATVRCFMSSVKAMTCDALRITSFTRSIFCGSCALTLMSVPPSISTNGTPVSREKTPDLSAWMQKRHCNGDPRL